MAVRWFAISAAPSSKKMTVKVTGTINTRMSFLIIGFTRLVIIAMNTITA